MLNATTTQPDEFTAFLDSVDTKGELPASTRTVKERATFPCMQCGGTGLFQGVRLHQEKEHCFACKGKGHFFSSELDRKRSRVKAEERKRKSRADAIACFDETHSGLGKFLCDTGVTGNRFAASLYEKLQKYGDLTERQLACAERMRVESAATPEDKANKAQEFDAANPGVRDFLTRTAATNEFSTAILEKLTKYGSLTPNQLAAVNRSMSQVAVEATTVPTLAVLANAFLSSSTHLKRPKLRLKTEDGLSVVLSRAGENSRNPGHIFVTDGGSFGANTYYGRLTPDGKPLWRNPSVASVVALLERFNADPKAEMLVQGQRTGCCCLCGRELTNKESLERGVGPVCAEKWGF